MIKKAFLLLMTALILLTGCAQTQTQTQNDVQASATDKIYLREAARYLQNSDDSSLNTVEIARNIRNGKNLTSNPEQFEQLAAYIEAGNFEAASSLYTELSGKEIK